MCREHGSGLTFPGFGINAVDTTLYNLKIEHCRKDSAYFSSYAINNVEVALSVCLRHSGTFVPVILASGVYYKYLFSFVY